ncbi:hypothetical protein [Microbacterium aurantiacum]|nr:hypothetical protein [Microbacterium aurantiacum]
MRADTTPTTSVPSTDAEEKTPLAVISGGGGCCGGSACGTSGD